MLYWKGKVVKTITKAKGHKHYIVDVSCPEIPSFRLEVCPAIIKREGKEILVPMEFAVKGNPKLWNPAAEDTPLTWLVK